MSIYLTQLEDELQALADYVTDFMKRNELTKETIMNFFEEELPLNETFQQTYERVRGNS